MASCGATKNGTDAAAVPNSSEPIVAGSVAAKGEYTAEKNGVFWGELLSEACTQSTSENICLSPLSAQLAMAMVANGAEGETKEEIYNAMQLGSDANAHSRELLDNLDNKSCEIKIANSIWVNKKLDVKQEFIDTNKENFDALVERIQFNDKALKRINDWCKENTNGKIESIIERLNKNDRMILLNALYFKATWDEPFQKNKTSDQKFTTEKGYEIMVPMMMMRKNASFYKDDVFAMTAKRFKGGYNMLLVLPNEGVKCEEAAKYLADDFDNILKNMSLCDLTLSMPKFTTNFDTSLKPMLANLGIERAFNGSAQFGGISDEPLFISDVVQKTYINVNEEGAEAAAVTGVRVGLLSMKAQKIEILTLDRPFIYAIINNNNEVLFAGKVGNPATK